MELTKNNFYKFGYNEKVFALRPYESATYWASYGKCTRLPKSWKEECLLAANEIFRAQESRLRVCFSGGVDSEMMAESFRLNGIDFVAVIMRFDNGLNQHDILYAEKYCQKHQIKVEYYDIDIIQYMESSDFLEIALKAGVIAPGIVFQIHMARSLSEKGLFPVLGAGDVWLKKIDNFWYVLQSEVFGAIHRGQLAFRFPGVMRFFHYTPEQVLSFLEDSTVRKMLSNGFPGVTSQMEVKEEILRPHFQLESRIKYTGVEKFKDLSDRKRMQLIERMPTSYNDCYINVVHALRALRP